MNAKSFALTASALLVMNVMPALADGMPVVPVSVMGGEVAEKGRELAKKHQQKINGSSGRTSSSAAINQDAVLTMMPGVNQIIPVAIGHPNRIVTPFGNPEVVSTSLSPGGGNGECGEVCIKDNVVYVATDQEAPVTMFITEKGSEAQALSLTMVPRKIPPREVFLKLSDQAVAGGLYSNPKAERWEKSTPYVETIRTVFRKMALGEIPQGYTMSDIPRNAVLPNCHQPGISVSFKQGQLVMGHNLSVFVGVAQNTTGDALEFQEATCGNWNVAAVTTWPLKVLEPGQKTELYVAMKKNTGRVAPTSKRPSLLGGRQ